MPHLIIFGHSLVRKGEDVSATMGTESHSPPFHAIRLHTIINEHISQLRITCIAILIIHKTMR